MLLAHLALLSAAGDAVLLSSDALSAASPVRLTRLQAAALADACEFGQVADVLTLAGTVQVRPLPPTPGLSPLTETEVRLLPADGSPPVQLLAAEQYGTQMILLADALRGPCACPLLEPWQLQDWYGGLKLSRGDVCLFSPVSPAALLDALARPEDVRRWQGGLLGVQTLTGPLPDWSVHLPYKRGRGREEVGSLLINSTDLAAFGPRP